MSSETAGTIVKRDVVLQPNRINTQDFNRNWWVATVEPHITREDLLVPSFWANIAVQFKQFDRVEVRTDDGQYFSEYLVLSCDRTSAYLKELTWVDLSEKTTSKSPEYETKWRGPHAKFSVIRIKDSSVMVEKLESKPEAETWLVEYLRKI